MKALPRNQNHDESNSVEYSTERDVDRNKREEAHTPKRLMSKKEPLHSPLTLSQGVPSVGPAYCGWGPPSIDLQTGVGVFGSL